jgi:hypothetical protein
MRIGVLTFHAGPNHGAFLQAASLLESIRQCGHQAEVIDYTHPRLRSSERFRPWIYRRPRRFLFDVVKRAAFRSDRKALASSKHFRSSSDILTQHYDAIIVGSDVVWNFQNARLGSDPVYAGVFERNFEGKRIAYAPSIGSMALDYVPSHTILNGIRQFRHISVRDDSSREWLRQVCALESVNVVDPTWLPPARRLGIPCRDIGASDMLIYAPIVEASTAKAIAEYAKGNGLRTVAVGYHQPWCEVNRADIGPLAWPTACRQSACIISATFHGTLFAIREKRPFVCLATEDMLNKTRHWLKQLGLSNRFWDKVSRLDVGLDQNIDWDSANHSIQKHAEKSLSWLNNALET